MGDFEDLSGPTEHELARARAVELRAGSVDPQDLANDLAQIQFNPDYATDVPSTTVLIDGQPVPVHQVRNFPLIFKIADFRMRRKTKTDISPIEQAVIKAMYRANYVEIFPELKMKYPALYLRMREVADNLEEQIRGIGPHGQGRVFEATQEEKDEWAFISSATYGAAAEIAKSLHPDYDLSQLYLRPL